MRTLITALVLVLASCKVYGIEPFVELDHYSKPTLKDYGLSMINVGVEQQIGSRFVLTGKIGTPIGANDMGKYGRYWDNGDTVVNISARIYWNKQ